MAYVKQEWKDEVINGGAPVYRLTRADGSVVADNVSIELVTQIIQAGTQVTAERMNHIEDGIAGITPASIGALPERPFVIEMSGSSWTGGFFDFHMGGTEEDFTTRVGEFARGTLGVIGNLTVSEYISAKNINDSGWLEMGLLNGWARVPNGLARFRKYNNVVYVIGQLSGAAATSPAFIQLPSGFRPHVQMTYPCVRDSNTPVAGLVGSDGIMWFTTTAYGNIMHFSGSWLGEV